MNKSLEKFPILWEKIISIEIPINETDTSGKRRKEREKNAGAAYTPNEWEELKQKYENKCLRCGSIENLVADHVISLYCGGSNTIDNIQPLCSLCNLWKGIKKVDFRT